MGDIVHFHDFLALNIGAAGQAQVALQGPGAVVELNALGCRYDRIHEHQKVKGAVVFFLMPH